MQIYIIIGSCLALNLGYAGCCMSYLTSKCHNKDCYCDRACHLFGDCCSDIISIGCFPIKKTVKVLSLTTSFDVTSTQGNSILDHVQCITSV